MHQFVSLLTALLASLAFAITSSLLLLVSLSGIATGGEMDVTYGKFNTLPAFGYCNKSITLGILRRSFEILSLSDPSIVPARMALLTASFLVFYIIKMVFFKKISVFR